jgi:hypothetical protein
VNFTTVPSGLVLIYLWFSLYLSHTRFTGWIHSHCSPCNSSHLSGLSWLFMCLLCWICAWWGFHGQLNVSGTLANIWSWSPCFDFAIHENDIDCSVFFCLSMVKAGSYCSVDEIASRNQYASLSSPVLLLFEFSCWQTCILLLLKNRMIGCLLWLQNPPLCW